jgi:hypothetical protein
MEKTREDASSGIADNNKGRGARGQQDERGSRGQQDERGSQGERIKSDGNEWTKRGCTYKERNKDKVPDSIRRDFPYAYHIHPPQLSHTKCRPHHPSTFR